MRLIFKSLEIGLFLFFKDNQALKFNNFMLLWSMSLNNWEYFSSFQLHPSSILLTSEYHKQISLLFDNISQLFSHYMNLYFLQSHLPYQKIIDMFASSNSIAFQDPDMLLSGNFHINLCIEIVLIILWFLKLLQKPSCLNLSWILLNLDHFSFLFKWIFRWLIKIKGWLFWNE